MPLAPGGCVTVNINMGGDGEGGQPFGPVDVFSSTVATVDAFDVVGVKGARIWMAVEDLTTGEHSSGLIHVISDGTNVQYSSPSDVGDLILYDVEMTLVGTTLNVQIQNNTSNTLRITGNRLLF
jgi:hypothetical protein